LTKACERTPFFPSLLWPVEEKGKAALVAKKGRGRGGGECRISKRKFDEQKSKRSLSMKKKRTFGEGGGLLLKKGKRSPDCFFRRGRDGNGYNEEKKSTNMVFSQEGGKRD